MRNANTWGVKLANSAVRCKVIGTVAERAGLAGFVVSGPSMSGQTYKTMDCEFIDCTAIDPGYNNFSASERSGFRVMSQSFDKDYPKGTKIIGCRAYDRQTTTRTMQYGFRTLSRMMR